MHYSQDVLHFASHILLYIIVLKRC